MLSRIFRKVLRILFNPFIRRELFDYSKLKTIISLNKNSLSREETSNYIFNGLKRNEPLMISRFGYSELNTLFRYENIIRMNKLENLVGDIYSALSPLSKGEALDISEEEIDNFGEAIKDVVRHWATPKARDNNTLRMSNIGKPQRKLWFDFKYKNNENCWKKTRVTIKQNDSDRQHSCKYLGCIYSFGIKTRY